MTDTSSGTDTTADVFDWIGHRLVDAFGDKVGKVAHIYLDEATGRPEWVAVTTGRFGSSVSFVPTDGCTVDGDDLVAPCAKDLVCGAPRARVDGRLEPAEVAALYQHYGRHLADTAKDAP